MTLSALQQQLAAIISALPSAEAFALAGGSALAAHGLLARQTKDLDYFASPKDADAVQVLAAAIEDACRTRDLHVRRERDSATFVRLTVTAESEQTEIDIAIDYRALDPVQTRYGPALDLRELGANKVLAIFDRAAPRDFLDLHQSTRRFPFDELVTLAMQKDPGLDLNLLGQALQRITRFSPQHLRLDDAGMRQLLVDVQQWQEALNRRHASERDIDDGPGLDR